MKATLTLTFLSLRRFFWEHPMCARQTRDRERLNKIRPIENQGEVFVSYRASPFGVSQVLFIILLIRARKNMNQDIVTYMRDHFTFQATYSSSLEEETLIPSGKYQRSQREKYI